MTDLQTDYEIQVPEMDFVRFDDCIIANLSLQEYYSKHGPTITLLFMEDLPQLPIIGFSIMPAQSIVKNKLRVGAAISYRTWHDWDTEHTLKWADKPVAKFDVLRILLHMDTNGILVRYRMNSYPTTCERAFDFPPNFQSAYLAISGSSIFRPEDNTCKIAIMNTQQMLKWMEMRKKPLSVVGQGAVVQSSDTQHRPFVDAASGDLSARRSVPKCLLCFENDVEILFLPCAHAMCCQKCKDDYISSAVNLPPASKFLNKRPEVQCPTCRSDVTAIGRIWFNSNLCLLCGCSEMTAVAGGRGGCGCIVGCYNKAIKALKPDSECPVCRKKIVKIIRVFIQSDGDMDSS